ncbi:ArpU family transcriptional regulator [Fodinisporobacter ferrooxydans]|uniref:ArpU family transcriptional regulator n=1 Tax=Fodinisporobacter ferrooxydans TaxID=2901836 RepID=A0ABY4CJV9_9BACL|nr:ArpU family transcriptional regulator [Alicyclobacillaceae bacterium MYW30-H2]
MVQQLSFELPEIDRQATRDAVERALETARFYKEVGFVPRMPPVSHSFPRTDADFIHGQNNNRSAVEEAAVYNVDEYEHRRQVVEQVERAVGRLGPLERKIITKKYLEQDEIPDYCVATELSLSERKYYRVKARAIYKLAFSLRIEVMHEQK